MYFIVNGPVLWSGDVTVGVWHVCKAKGWDVVLSYCP